MVGVFVDSGSDPLAVLEAVPQAKWADLALARRSYIRDNFTRDCRRLLQWLQDAERMWVSLGYRDADDMIRRCLDLEPEEVRLVCRWLELNDPNHEVPYSEALNKAQQEADKDRKDQRKPGNPTGANQHTKGKVGTDSNRNNSSKRPIGTTRKQALRKLRQEAEKDGADPRVQEIYRRVLAEEISPHRGMVEAGFRKVPTLLEQAKKAVARLSEGEWQELLARKASGR
jgi:HrpA-like RNA helicase